MSDWTVVKSNISNLLQPGATNSTSVPDIRNSLFIIIDQINGPDQNYEEDIWKPNVAYPKDIKPVLYRDKWLVSNIAGNEGNEPINSGGLVHGSWRVVNVSAKSVVNVWQAGVFPNILEIVFENGQLYYLDREVVGNDVFSSLDFDAELAEDPAKWKAVGILDEAHLDSNSPFQAASQKSVKTYIDALETAIDENLSVDDPDYNTRQKIVNEIRSNDSEIDDLYNIKANKADVINNLTTNDPSKIASANTAFLLKNLVDGILANLSVDDPTYDTRQKLLNFLKSNKALITALQADKVNFTDIADNLTTNDPSKVASANTVVLLKGMVDNIYAILASDDTTLDEIQELVDFIKQNREDLNALTIPNIAGLQAALDSKVDKIGGKGLSTNDLTNTLLANYNFAHAFASTFSIADYHAALDGRYLKIEDTPTSGTVGEVVFFAGATPNGVTIADGRAVNRLGAYADLFAAIGTDYGEGDGATTFNLPSWSGRNLSPDGAASSDKLVYTGKYQAVALVSNAELVLSGEQTIGGVNYTEDQLIYARNQSTISERKIYQVKTGAWVALAAVDYDSLFIVGSGSVFKTEGGGYVTSDFDILNSIPSDSRAIVSYPDADVIQIEITNHLGAFHAGIRFSVVGNSNQGLLSPNEVLGTDSNGDISVLGLGSNLQLVASVLSVKNGIFEPVFAKKEGFNNDYGTAAGTVAQGNDSRIVNGQTAYGFTSTFSIENYHAALDGRYLQSHPDTSNQDTVLLNGAAVLSSLVLDEYGHITSITTRNLLPPNIGAEPAIGAKGTAFNDNYGATAGTVAQGNDSRINNGQTAYNWGNHAEAGYATQEWVMGQIANMAKTNVNNNFSVGQTVNGDFQVTGLTLLDAGLGVDGSANVTGDVTASNFKRPV